MFSETMLGSFLREIFSGRRFELMQSESALALATLLLADESITQDPKTRNEIRGVLAGIYGDSGVWRSCEQSLREPIVSELALVLADVNQHQYCRANAYIAGLLGVGESLSFPTNEHCQRIHARGLRIFHGRKPILIPHGTNLFIGIVGLKGSGKSSLLHLLEREGEHVLEIYRELDRIKKESPGTFATLPPRTGWEDEPLRLVLNRLNVTTTTQKKIFLGSLLRQSEIELLSAYGRIVLVHLASNNSLRHARARSRGRVIENTTDDAWLIELDAHRDGLWPGYEQNDLGALVDLCGDTIVNDAHMSPEKLYQSLQDILRKEA